jgi:hypothetical protein
VSYDCDLEQPACYREIRRKARKPHRCGDCGGMVHVGEHYLYISGIWEGEPSSYTRCYDCQHLRCEIRKDRGTDDCMALNGLRPWLEDYCDRGTKSPWQRWAGMFNAIATARNSTRRIIVTVEDYACPSTDTAAPDAVFTSSGATQASPSPSVSG